MYWRCITTGRLANQLKKAKEDQQSNSLTITIEKQNTCNHFGETIKSKKK